MAALIQHLVVPPEKDSRRVGCEECCYSRGHYAMAWLEQTEEMSALTAVV